MKRIMRLFVALLVVLAATLGIVRYVVDASSGQKAAERIGIPYPLVIAHRGASYLAPEETLPAFVLARELGADFLELDIQRTKDGVLIAFHDDTPGRTTNAKERYPGRENDTIDKFTWAELKELDAGSWFNAAHPDRARDAYRGLHILTLEEVLGLASKGSHAPGLYIEAKAPERYPGVEKQLVELLTKHGWIGPSAPKGKLILQSFDSASLAKFRELVPSVPRTYLIHERMVGESSWKHLVDVAKDDMGVGPIGYLGWPWNFGYAHNKGKFVHVWTINEPRQFRALSFTGADGFFTDRCDLLLAYYGRELPASPEEILKRIGY